MNKEMKLTKKIIMKGEGCFFFLEVVKCGEFSSKSTVSRASFLPLAVCWVQRTSPPQLWAVCSSGRESLCSAPITLLLRCSFTDV